MSLLTTKLCQFGQKLTHCQLTVSFRSISSSSTIIDPSFGLRASERQLQSVATQFALNEFRPFSKEWDEKEFFPREQVAKAASLGFAGLYVSAENGGSGLTRLETSVIFESLAQGCVSTTALLSLHNTCASMLDKFGSEQQRERFLAKLVNFEAMASYCLTEPSAGSDGASLLTTAIKKDGYYLLNGTKAFISGGGESDMYFIMVRTGGPGPKGVSCILVEKGTEGLSFGKKEHKMGWSSQPTRAVILEDAKVPVENLLGEEGRGFRYAMNGMNSSRLNIASCSLGGAQWAMEETIQYCTDRKQFSSRLLDFQNTQFQLAHYATELLASRLLVRAASQRIDEEEERGKSDPELGEIDNSHIPLPSLCAAGKLMATEKSFAVIDGCLQLFGGYGYLKDFPIQQLLRDSRVHRILGGTSEIMKMLIARDFY